MCRPQMKRGPLSISAPQNALHWPHMLFDVRLAISAALKYARERAIVPRPNASGFDGFSLSNNYPLLMGEG